MLHKRSTILSLVLAVAGLLTFLGDLRAGDFTVTVVNTDGTSITDTLTLTVKDSGGTTVNGPYTTTTGAFAKFTVNGANLPVADKTVTFTIMRGNTTLTIPGLNGDSLRSDVLIFTIGPRS